jgi:hypothetical protein
VPGGAILVGRSGKIVPPRFFGRQGPEQEVPPIRPDAMFLLASITKPITYLGAMRLVERGCARSLGGRSPGRSFLIWLLEPNAGRYNEVSWQPSVPTISRYGESSYRFLARKVTHTPWWEMPS